MESINYWSIVDGRVLLLALLAVGAGLVDARHGAVRHPEPVPPPSSPPLPDAATEASDSLALKDHTMGCPPIARAPGPCEARPL